jgi:poly-beta-1,6-N-acetyl-D-glucosamine synthase
MLINSNLTVLIPCFNEEKNITRTIYSIKNQSIKPFKIIVIDDCSTDLTSIKAALCKAQVIKTLTNKGSKAAALNYGLGFVSTDYVLVIDADTVLQPRAIEIMLKALKHNNLDGASGMVMPKYRKTIWEKGRYIEYILAFNIFKPIQNYFGKPLITSGCFCLFKTNVIKSLGGWPERTITEDLDLTWLMFENEFKLGFVPKALCQAIEPHNFTYLKRQLRRWTRGFMVNGLIHWQKIKKTPYLNILIPAVIVDSFISIFFIFLIPFLTAIFISKTIALAMVAGDFLFILIPSLYWGIKTKELNLVLTSLPAYFILRLINSYFTLEAFIQSYILKKPYLKFEKGHI